MTGRIVTSLLGFALSVDVEKITRYILNPTHPRGAAKAAWFSAFGFSQDRPQELIDAFVTQAWNARRVICRDHPRGFGVEVSAIGPIWCPDSRLPVIRTAWNWRPDSVVRVTGRPDASLVTFVTAYPE